MENKPRPKKSMFRFSKTKLTVVTSLIILVLIGLLIVQFLSSPAQGSVRPEQHQIVQSSQPTFDTSPVTVVGTQASFTVPKALHRLPDESVSAPVLESFNYDYLANSRWRLAVSVQTATTNPYGFDASYQAQAEHPDQYKKSIITVNGHGFRILTDVQASGFAQVAYLTSGNRTVTIALSGAAQSDIPYLQKTFSTVLESWQWK